MQTLIIKDFAKNTTKKVRVGDTVSWLQRGLNRWLNGTVISITKEPADYPNEASIEIELESGKKVRTRAWQLL